jgi:hypothetical protein
MTRVPRKIFLLGAVWISLAASIGTLMARLTTSSGPCGAEAVKPAPIASLGIHRLVWSASWHAPVSKELSASSLMIDASHVCHSAPGLVWIATVSLAERATPIFSSISVRAAPSS